MRAPEVGGSQQALELLCQSSATCQPLSFANTRKLDSVFKPTYPFLEFPHSLPSTKSPLSWGGVVARLVVLDAPATYWAIAVALQLAAAALHTG